MESNETENAVITRHLGDIEVRLDVVINLMLDLLSDERFDHPRRLTHKVKRLDATGIELKPNEIGRIVGRKSKDISSRRREIASARARKSAKPKEAKKS